MKSYAVPTPQSGDYLASMAESGSFYIGCELELLVRSKKRHTEWMALAQEISKRLRQAGIANHIPNDKSRPDYTKWSIVQEITIPQPDKHTCWSSQPPSPFELVMYPWRSYERRRTNPTTNSLI